MQHYVYHPDHSPKVVGTDEYAKLLESGWYDTPEKFPEVKPTGLSAEEKKKIKDDFVAEKAKEATSGEEKTEVVVKPVKKVAKANLKKDAKNA